MRFAQPLWLLAGAFAVVLLLILRIRSEVLTTRAMNVLSGARLVDTKALPSRFRRWLRVAVVSCAVAMGFVALARPQKGMQWQTLDRQGTDILLVVDTSKSMNADDVRPTRLERTKLAVRDLAERFPGDRIGLVAFAGDAFVESPMTLDHDALLETLSAFDTSIIARGGTDIGRAIDVGASALKADSGNQRVMVLLTDGEDLESQGLDAAKRAGEAGITIETVGVGTPAGELVPATNDATDGQPATVGLMRDENGAPVRSRLDESGLRAIAQAAHGTYRPLGADGRGLDRLYDEVLAPLAHTEHGARVRRVYAEWFAVPLALSVFGVVLDALLGWRPRSRTRVARRARGGSSLLRPGVMAAIAVALLLPTRAYASVADAEKAYAAGKFDDAAREYDAEQTRHPRDARLAVDAGAAAYRAGHYDAAEAAFGKALTTADPKLQQRVLYDLGDVRYRLGATTLADAPEKTKERWKSAIAAYEGALALAPTDADAAYNRDFVKRKLAELEAKQKPQPQESQAKQDQKNGGSGQEQSKGASGRDQAKGGTGQDQAKGGTGQDQAKGGTNGGKDPAAKNDGANDRSGGTSSPPLQAQADANGGQGGAQDRAPASGQRQDPALRGAPSGQQAGSGSSASGSEGRLSPREARALLGLLRSDERRGVATATSGAPVTTDAPQKDW